MPVRGQSVNVTRFHVQWKRAQSLDGFHEKETIVPLADGADRVQIGPKTAQVLYETDGQEPGAGASHLDLFQWVMYGKPVDGTPIALQAQPRVVISRELLPKGDYAVARTPP